MGAGARYESVQVLVLNPRLSGNSVYIYTHTHTDQTFSPEGFTVRILFLSPSLLLATRISRFTPFSLVCRPWAPGARYESVQVLVLNPRLSGNSVYIYTHTHTDQTFSPEGFTVRILFLPPSLLLATRISRFTPFSLVCRPWALVRDMSQSKFLS